MSPRPLLPSPGCPLLARCLLPTLTPWLLSQLSAVAPSFAGLPSNRCGVAFTSVTSLPAYTSTISAASSTPTGPPPTITMRLAALILSADVYVGGRRAGRQTGSRQL